nr:hypothetical protein Iba_chr13fCG6850 [Ipomoea batatas]
MEATMESNQPQPPLLAIFHPKLKNRDDGRRGEVPASELRLPLVSVLLGSSGFRLPLSVSGENATQQRHGEASSLLLRSPSGGATQRGEAADGTAAYPSPSRQPRASTAATAVSGSGGVGDGLLYGESPLLSLPATSSSDGCGKHGSHGLRLRLSPLVDGRRGGVPASELRLPLVSVLLGSSGFRLPLSVSGENATQQRHGEASSLLLRTPSGGATQRGEAADGTAAYPSP